MTLLFAGITLAHEGKTNPFSELTEEQQQELRSAFDSGDREQVAALLSEYSIEKPVRGMRKNGPSEAVRDAIENNNYTAFQAAVTAEDPIASIITDAEKFSQLVAFHEARKNGDTETAEALRAELGLEIREKGSRGFGHGRKGNPENREQIETAIESGDYEAWKALVGEKNPFAEKITAENFSLLQELHEARENRDMETIQEIHEQLGIELPPRFLRDETAPVKNTAE